MEDLQKQFSELQAKFVEQSERLRDYTGLLEQAREDQRQALAMAKVVIEQKATAPATVFIQRDRRCPDFSGSTSPGEVSVAEWIASMKAYFQVCKVPEEDQVEVLKQHLKGEAKFTVKLKLESGAKSADEIFLALKEVYGDKTPIGVRLREFYDRRQAAGEKVRAYAYDLQDKLNQLKAQDSTRVPDIDVMLKEQFVIGLRDDTLRREMKKEVKEKPTQTFSALMQAAIDWCEEEEISQDPSSKNQARGAVHVAQAVDPPTALSLQSLHDNIQKIAARQEELFRAMQGASDHQGRPRRPPLKDDEGRLICYTCSEPGHTSRTCPRNQGKDGGGPVCYACGQPGHTSRTCRRGQGKQPKNNSIASDIRGEQHIQGQTRESVSTTSTGPTMATSFLVEEHQAEPRSACGSCLTLDVLIDGVKTRCLLDTGSEVTTISAAYFQEQFEGKKLSPANWIKLTAANGLDIPVIGCLYADIECMGEKVLGKCVFVLRDHPINEAEKRVPGILGMNVLSDLRSLFSGVEGAQMMDRSKMCSTSASLRRVISSLVKEEQLVGPGGKMGRVKVAGRQAIVIPPRCETVIEGRCRIPPKSRCQVLVEASPDAGLPSGVLVANVLTQCTKGKVSVRLLNTSQEPVTLHPRSRVAEISKPKQVLPRELVAFEETEGDCASWSWKRR
ncbi:hypothetical protein AAFF_G00355700 [Aldrovandia affinis]|uniref:CCHC-type domain-containing protein n=1 Tax=Aldrovandia affinis TaxID=143900 RepID=A0AAD7R5F6_9TELE|nr:hypothetical protein AAFF_G00355700 [Aldrovandia affinis]